MRVDLRVTLLLLLAVVAWTFKVTNDSQIALDRVSELRRQLEAERIEIELLKSDWALLTSPQRLEQLVKKYGDTLDLVQIESSQIVDTGALPPVRPSFDPDAVRDELAGTDSTVNTGSVIEGDDH